MKENVIKAEAESVERMTKLERESQTRQAQIEDQRTALTNFQRVGTSVNPNKFPLVRGVVSDCYSYGQPLSWFLHFSGRSFDFGHFVIANPWL